jgi:hypothetical protein
VALLSPLAGTIFHPTLPGTPYPVQFQANASDLSGVLSVEYKIEVLSFTPGPGSPGLHSIHTVSPGFPPAPFDHPYDWSFAEVQTLLGSDCAADGFLVVEAIDNCGNTAIIGGIGSTDISVRRTTLPPIPLGCLPTFPGPSSLARPGDEVGLQAPNQRPATWVSQLDVPGGRGQIVLNGSEALFPAAGRVPLSARPRPGDNRVEAQLVQAQGRAGLWRFELAPDTMVAGSLRVIAGQVALVTGDAVVFRLKGQPGERIVFTFRSR